MAQIALFGLVKAYKLYLIGDFILYRSAAALLLQIHGDNSESITVDWDISYNTNVQ